MNVIDDRLTRDIHVNTKYNILYSALISAFMMFITQNYMYIIYIYYTIEWGVQHIINMNGIEDAVVGVEYSQSSPFIHFKTIETNEFKMNLSYCETERNLSFSLFKKKKEEEN